MTDNPEKSIDAPRPDRTWLDAHYQEVRRRFEALMNFPPPVTSVKLVEIRGRREVAIGQAARGGIWMGSAVSVAASSAMASTCM